MGFMADIYKESKQETVLFQGNLTKIFECNQGMILRNHAKKSAFKQNVESTLGIEDYMLPNLGERKENRKKKRAIVII